MEVLSEHLSFLLQSGILVEFKQNKDPQHSPMKVATVFRITSVMPAFCKLLLRYKFSGMSKCKLKLFSKYE